jgi:hypothetical protein
MQPLPVVLNSYIRSDQLWRCPADTGFDQLDMAPTGPTSYDLAARPTLFDAFHTSYFYRTELAIFGRSQNNLTAHDFNNNVYNAAEINVLMDGNGFWHGSGGVDGRRFSVLMGDGHAVSQGIGQYFKTWSLVIDH